MKTTRRICLTAMGVALYVVLALCLQVPVFENYYLCLGYVSMMVFCYYFGALSGMTVGTLGVVLYCLLTNGLRGLPGWAAGNLVIGLAVGLTCSLTKKMRSQVLRNLIIAAAVVASTAAGILGMKSVVEVILYAQPMLVRVAKNVYALIADVVVLIAALPICICLRKTVEKVAGPANAVKT